jgi:hypothetical protein
VCVCVRACVRVCTRFRRESGRHAQLQLGVLRRFPGVGSMAVIRRGRPNLPAARTGQSVVKTRRREPVTANRAKRSGPRRSGPCRPASSRPQLPASLLHGKVRFPLQRHSPSASLLSSVAGSAPNRRVCEQRDQRRRRVLCQSFARLGAPQGVGVHLTSPT